MGKGVKNTSVHWLNTLQSTHVHTHTLFWSSMDTKSLSELVSNVKLKSVGTDLFTNDSQKKMRWE